jgi:hypothetical protein
MEEAAEPETDYTTGTPWLYVDLEGNVTVYLAPEDRVNIW